MMCEEERGTVVMTYSGNLIDPFNPDPDKIRIIDIAHSLANQARYGGHLSKFKTVAEHCIETCEMARSGEKLEALLHDAPEYLLLDMASPTKWRIKGYIEAEKNLMAVISKKYKINPVKSEDISLIDKALGEVEYRDYMLNKGKGMKPMKRGEAKRVFLEMFNRYKR